MRGLDESVINRSLHPGQALYILADGQHRVLAGNLDAWPAITADPGNFVEFDYERRVNGVPETPARPRPAVSAATPGGNF